MKLNFRALFAYLLIAMISLQPAFASDQSQFTSPNQQFLDNDGAVLSGGKLYFYEAGTSTPIDTYSDANKTVPNSNPIILDSAGRSGAVYMEADDYKIVLKDADDVTLWTRDNYTVSSTSSIGGGLESADGTLRAAAEVNNQTGTSYTIQTTDRGKLLTFSNASTINVTLPQADSSDFPDGWYIDIANRGVGAVSIVPSTSTIDGAASFIVPSNTGIRLFSDGTNYFLQRGDQSFRTEANLASATTTDLGSVGSHVINITGTTTITSFGSSASTSAPIYFVKFADALTLTHNSPSLILPSGANILTAAGDTLIAKHEGSSNWRVLSYTKASGRALSGAVQVVESTYTTNSTASTTIPADDTIPQNTEGTEILTASITPTSTTSKIVVEWEIFGSVSGGATQYIAAPLFKDSTANALSTPYALGTGSSAVNHLYGSYQETSGSLTARTFKVRVGVNTGNFYPNGTGAASRIYGGTSTCRLRVYEIQ